MRIHHYIQQDINHYWLGVDLSGGEDACWEWLGATSSGGYGHLSFAGRRYGAHRLAYELFHGKFPTELKVLHSCDNPLCCNPKHLFLGTQLDNMRDMKAKGRDSSRRHILSIEQKAVIHERYKQGGITQKQLSIEFEVSLPSISRIVNKAA